LAAGDRVERVPRGVKEGIERGGRHVHDVPRASRVEEVEQEGGLALRLLDVHDEVERVGRLQSAEVRRRVLLLHDVDPDRAELRDQVEVLRDARVRRLVEREEREVERRPRGRVPESVPGAIEVPGRVEERVDLLEARDRVRADDRARHAVLRDARVEPGEVRGAHRRIRDVDLRLHRAAVRARDEVPVDRHGERDAKRRVREGRALRVHPEIEELEARVLRDGRERHRASRVRVQ